MCGCTVSVKFGDKIVFKSELNLKKINDFISNNYTIHRFYV